MSLTEHAQKAKEEMSDKGVNTAWAFVWASLQKFGLGITLVFLALAVLGFTVQTLWAQQLKQAHELSIARDKQVEILQKISDEKSTSIEVMTKALSNNTAALSGVSKSFDDLKDELRRRDH